MRKFKRRTPRTLLFRLFLILSGALLLLAAFAPRANADCPACIRYYNFEGTDTTPYPFNLDSNAPAIEQGTTFRMFLDTGTDPTMAATGSFPSGNVTAEPGLPLNVAPMDPAANLTSFGLHRSGEAQLYMDIPMFSGAGIYDVTSVTFAVAANGNGYEFVSLLISTNGGATFALAPGTVTQVIPNGPGSIITFNITPGSTLNQPTLILRLAFTGGRSNGNDLQNEFDNIQVNGTVVPEPATVAGGLLGVLGLCWFQRKRLIRSVRFRRT